MKINQGYPINIMEYLEETKIKYPDKKAAIDENSIITYKELYEDVKCLGLKIEEVISEQKQESVIILIDKSIDCLKAMLGVLYSGHYYVVMDVKTPKERFAEIVKTLENKILITTSEYSETCGKLGYTGEIIYIDGIERSSDYLKREERPYLTRIDTDLAYVLFTSGSTGVPKGVAITHRSVIDYVEAYTEEVQLAQDDILGNQSPFYFDVSLKDIYMAQKVGATLCIIPSKYFMTPKKLLNYLANNEVSAIAWVPTAYRIIAKFNGLEKVKPQSLKKFIFSGEAMPIAVYQYWKKEYPDGVFIQQYGPTEITGACVSYRVEREFNEDETIPIGKPFRNTKILLINEQGRYIRPDETNIVGEIFVKGSCLAVGYYNNWEKTKEGFVQNPLNDKYPDIVYQTGDLAYWNELQELVFVSRKDFQIKHSGHRIELGEIESRIMSIEGACNGCCCIHDREKDEIVCFYVKNKLDKKQLVIMAHEKLPKYMLPAIYYEQEELPILPNGKIDRKKMDTQING